MATKSALQELAEAAELNVQSYSGRYMYGKSCLGIEGDDVSDIFVALFQAAADTEPNMQEVADQMRNHCRDQMGRGAIVYFPGVEYVSDDRDDEEEDYSLEEAERRGVFG